MLNVVAMSVTAKALGFPGVATLIQGDQLSPARVAALFAVAASERVTKDGAVIVLCAVTARFNAATNREGFDGDHERDLALWLLDGGNFDAANKLAVKIVQKHWREIQKDPLAFSKSLSGSIGIGALDDLRPFHHGGAMQPLQKETLKVREVDGEIDLSDHLIPTQYAEDSVRREMGMRRAIFLLIASLLLWCGSMLVFLDLANASDNQGQVALIGSLMAAIGGIWLWADYFGVTAWFARELASARRSIPFLTKLWTKTKLHIREHIAKG